MLAKQAPKVAGLCWRALCWGACCGTGDGAFQTGAMPPHPLMAYDDVFLKSHALWVSGGPCLAFVVVRGVFMGLFS